MPFFRIGRSFALAFAAAAIFGCDAEDRSKSVAARVSGLSEPPAPASAPESDAMFAAPGGAKMPAGSADVVPNPSATAGRKIIYNARIDMVTEDLTKLETTLNALISTQKAYVADSDRTGSAGTTRRGSWKVRVPVETYDGFVKGVVGLGELVSIKADSQDVSEEYFDLDARQAAKKVEEDRLLKHLTDSTGKLEEILAVERELSRVRVEIERMQGRLRALANLTSLATVTILVSEIKGYVPPQAPTLGTKLARTFAGSVDSLRQLGETLLIAGVALVPWLPLIALGLVIVYWTARKLIRWMMTIHWFDPIQAPTRRP